MAAATGKAFTAAETHSIGKSILARADANPLMAAWDYDGLLPCRLESGGARRAARVVDSGTHSARLAATHLGQSRFQGTLLGAIFSLPGMIMHRCAAPVAAGMRKQQVSMGGALAFWMGRPLLNPATLVFMGFVLGWQFALVRWWRAATVLTVATLVQKWVKEAATQPVAVPAAPSEATQGGFFSRWLRALWTLFWNTIPVYILAVLVLGAARVWLFPHADGVVDNTLFWVIAMAIAGCLFVIPTAAEIPIVRTMMLAGMGTAPALALLITLPAVSVPSLIMLRKAFRPKRCG